MSDARKAIENARDHVNAARTLFAGNEAILELLDNAGLELGAALYEYDNPPQPVLPDWTVA